MTVTRDGFVIVGNVTQYTAIPVYDTTGIVLLYIRYTVTVNGG